MQKIKKNEKNERTSNKKKKYKKKKNKKVTLRKKCLKIVVNTILLLLRRRGALPPTRYMCKCFPLSYQVLYRTRILSQHKVALSMVYKYLRNPVQV